MRRTPGSGSVYYITGRSRWAVAFSVGQGRRSIRTFETKGEALQALQAGVNGDRPASALVPGITWQSFPSLLTTEECRFRFREALKDKDVRAGGFVYFIKSDLVALIKIGTARDVPSRLNDIQNNSPVRLHLLGVITGGQALEQIIHAIFRNQRAHGEWFYETPELIDFIEEFCVLSKVSPALSGSIRNSS